MNRWILSALVLAACGDDGDVENGTLGGTQTGSTGASSSSADGSSSGSASQGSSGTTVGSESSGDVGDTTVGQLLVCADIVCAPGEICITPCCGGPAPACGPVRGPTCPENTHPVDACANGQPCEGTCCEDDPCVPEFPYCIGMDEVMCTKDPNSTTPRCSVDSCFGPLVDDNVACECA